MVFLENKIVHLLWLYKSQVMDAIDHGHIVEPIPGYRSGDDSKACKIHCMIGKRKDIKAFEHLPWVSTKIFYDPWEDFELTAEYIFTIETCSDTYIQMFDRLSNEEKVRSLNYPSSFKSARDYVHDFFFKNPTLISKKILKDLNVIIMHSMRAYTIFRRLTL